MNEYEVGVEITMFATTSIVADSEQDAINKVQEKIDTWDEDLLNRLLEDGVIDRDSYEVTEAWPKWEANIPASR